MNGLRLLTALGILLFFTASLSVLAEHEPSHRYFVSGIVLQEDGSPACGVMLEVLDRSGTTDHRGRYRIQLHLHDATVSPTENDVGAVLVVRVAGTNIVKTTTATPGPADDGWGESRVDFTVSTALGKACTNPVLLVGLYVGIPLVVATGGAFAYFKVIRPKWNGRTGPPSLSSLPGIGRGRMQEFRRIGIRTLEDLADADPSTINRGTSVSRKEAKRLIRRAQEMLQRRETG